MKVAAIIQARMGSTRYPGKVLELISNHPVLYHIIERIRESQHIDVIVVATTTEAEDKILLKRAREFSVRCFAGSVNDLVKRFSGASQLVDADVIVRIPCDNPLFEPSFIDDCVMLLDKEKADYCYVEDAVLGTGVDVFTRDALAKVNEESKEPHHREHIITHFKENPDKFKIVTLKTHERYKLPTLRLTFDTKEDLKLIRSVYHKFYHEDYVIPLIKVISFLKQNPEVAGLNAEVIQKAAEESELAAKAEAEARAASAAAVAAETAAEKEAAAKEAEEQVKLEAEEKEEILFAAIKESVEEKPPEEDVDKPDIFTAVSDGSKDEDAKETPWDSLFKDGQSEENKGEDSEKVPDEEAPVDEETPVDEDAPVDEETPVDEDDSTEPSEEKE